MNRRGFLKRVGGAALAVVTAPLYIPSERLDFGVPARRLILSSDYDDAIKTTTLTWDNTFCDAEAIGLMIPIPEKVIDQYEAYEFDLWPNPARTPDAEASARAWSERFRADWPEGAWDAKYGIGTT